MKKTVNTFHFSFLISCFICFLAGAKEETFAQDSLPVRIVAGKPQVIQVPVNTGESYALKTNEGTINIKLQPPKVLPLQTIKSISTNKGGVEQTATGNASFTRYTTDDGLALDAVFSSCMDHFGNLWFGTQGGGASKYDGKSFVTYTTAQGLASNNIWNIMEDKLGNIWFCTNGGVSKYDGKSFVTYALSKKQESNNVWSIAQDKNGNIWLGTSGRGISKYDGKSFVNYTTAQGLANNTVKSIFEDKSGFLWFGTDGGGVSKYDGKSFVNYTTADGLVSDYVYSIAEDKMGNIWLGSKDGGASKYDGRSFVNYTTAQGLAGNNIRNIHKDKSGDLWFATDGGGISRYDGESFVNYTTTQGLTNNYASSITEDKTGNIWFCTNGGGVSKYEGKSFVNYTTAQGLSHNTVWTIEEDKKGNIWAGTNAGLSRFDGNFFTSYIAEHMNTIILCIESDEKGAIWFGTYGGGIYKFDGTCFVNYTTAQGLSSNAVRSILEDETGNFWIGTDGGVSYFDGKSFTNYTMAQGLVNNLVYSILKDKKGNSWFGTNGGVSCFDGHSFTNYTTAQGLANNAVYNILEDETNHLWFATQQGLSYLTLDGGTVNPINKNFNLPLFKTISTENGLPDNYITQVIELPNGKIAVGTNLGIALFNYPDFKKTKLKGLELFNSSMGYPVKDVNVGKNAMYRDSKGLIWISTGSDRTGLVCFDYTAVHRNLSKPKVVIQNIKIAEENICWEYIRQKNKAEKEHTPALRDSLHAKLDSLSLLMSEFYAFGKNVPQSILDSQFTRFSDVQFDDIAKFYPLPKNLVLPYSHNQLSFEFAAIEPARPYMVHYQYILEGYNKEWSPVTNRTSVSFGNIYEGTYIFKLRAQSPFGVWSEPITYTFTVLPPWWRTWWVYTSYVLLGICTVFVITWWNSRRLRLKAKELAQEVHKATAIILEQKKIVEEQKHFVEEKNKHITDSINYAQRIQNAILPEADYIRSLFDNYFIYYQPKEIVSGDFYWFGEKDDKVIFAAVDCTGHGVPGALMSMIGNTLLNEIVNGKEIKASDEILNHLRNDIIRALKQTDAPESQKDGMDIALCVLDKNKKMLEFSGAHNSLYHFRNGLLKEVKGDAQAIGYEKKEQQPFVKNKIEIQDGDMLYLCTDGFADQKGGIEKKKFYYQPFRQLLASVKDESMIRQEEILRTTFNEWKGNLEQIDDVLIIGIKL